MVVTVAGLKLKVFQPDRGEQHILKKSNVVYRCLYSYRQRVRVITGVKMLWTHEVQPSESATNFNLFLPQHQRQRKWFFFSERELKKALRDTLMRAALSGLLSTAAN